MRANARAVAPGVSEQPVRDTARRRRGLPSEDRPTETSVKQELWSLLRPSASGPTAGMHHERPPTRPRLGGWITPGAGVSAPWLQWRWSGHAWRGPRPARVRRPAAPQPLRHRRPFAEILLIPAGVRARFPRIAGTSMNCGGVSRHEQSGVSNAALPGTAVRHARCASFGSGARANARARYLACVVRCLCRSSVKRSRTRTYPGTPGSPSTALARRH
jgi:hypothetical protein